VAAGALLADRRFVAAGMLNASSFAMRQGGRNVLLVLYATQVHGYSVGSLGVLFSAMAGVDLCLIPLAAWLGDAVADRRRVVVPATLGCAAAVSTIALGGADPHVFGGALLFWSLSTACVGPAVSAYAAEIVPKERRGLGVSLYRCAGDVGFVGAPFALGLVADFGGTQPALLLLGAATACCAGAFAHAGEPVQRAPATAVKTP
jgi:dipeptide/tripeptide permease